MPMYEFQCTCGTLFEKLIRGVEGAPASHPCPACGEGATRKITGFGFSFGDGKVHGNTGVHSLDTDIDLRVGRDSKDAWETYKDRFSRKRQVQRDAGGEGQVPLKVEGGDYVPMKPDEVTRFQRYHRTYSKVLSEHRQDREAKGIPQVEPIKPS
jgi:putative FmdB family regulatory protein